MSKLYYDSNCPVCNFVKAIIAPAMEGCEFIPLNENVNEIKYICKNGLEYRGDVAIKIIQRDYPNVIPYTKYLPDILKKDLISYAYTIADNIRTIIKKKCSRCGRK